MTGSSRRADVRAAIEGSLALLRDDPPRLKRILREAGGLADDVAAVLLDAARPADAKQLRMIAKLLRAAALLPAGLAVAGLKKAAAKALADRG